MEITREMISMEKIKPSSPTPHHLRIYKISLLDQMIPGVYIPVVLYFSGGSGGGGRIELLKESLSQTLATFYPFAGVLRDALSLDCNDDGVPFSVAAVKGQIRDFLQNPNFELISTFLPDEYISGKPPAPGANTMLIQLNCFDCGGIAMSIVFAHNIADLTSFSIFLRHWAANARGGGYLGFAELNCTAQSSFPQRPSLPMKLSSDHNLMKYRSLVKPLTRRYVFDASALSTLKAELRSSATGAAPSRVDVASAVIAKCFMEAADADYLITHAVNLRRRAAPHLPEDSFGNFLWAPAVVCGKGQRTELRELVWEGKKAIARIDEEFVRCFEGDDEEIYGYLGEQWKEIPQRGRWLNFTSWANMGLYDVDFGWGKPLWVSGIVLYNPELEPVFPNVVTLIDTRRRDGIEAWVNMDPKFVEGFEKNDVIRKYARVNPSVI